jgi:hypothetical protein
MDVADDKHDGFVQAIAIVDQAIAARKAEEWGTGTVTCPICGDVIAYRFKRTKSRLLTRMQCRTVDCFVAMT